MNLPPKGYYRQLLSDFPQVRIAFTHTPIVGCRTIDAGPFIEVLEQETNQIVDFDFDEVIQNKFLVFNN
jgi:hypothetical protein